MMLRFDRASELPSDELNAVGRMLQIAIIGKSEQQAATAQDVIIEGSLES